MHTVPASTPSTPATRSPSWRTAGSQCRPHEAIESFSHSSMNCVAYCRARPGIAPSEWLMRWTPLASVGNSARVASRSASSGMAGAHATTARPSMALPARPGYYGPFGGRFVAETLVPALDELAEATTTIVTSEAFQARWRGLLASYVGRPTPLGEARRLARAIDPDRIGHLWLKREDLCHTGAHKINNALGQVLLAHEMGKTRVIAETGAGQHGVATATACALLGLPCEVYMGAEDVKRQAPNVGRMQLLGAKVVPVESGSRTLKDAMNEALRDWVTNVGTTHYCIGSAAGPHPYPELVASLQSVIGEEARAQFLALAGPSMP